MLFDPLVEGRLVQRYKRFLADVRLAGGEVITAHCPNTGAMTGCATPGSRVWLSRSANPKRKYPHTWELIEIPADGTSHLVCIHSARANALAESAVREGRIPALAAYEHIAREKKYGAEGSRADLLLSAGDGRAPCLVEVKSVTLALGNGLGAFPDAVSLRARKHLRELVGARQGGARAVMLFCALHTGIREVAPAAAIDPAYAQALREARDAGVELLAYGATITPQAMRLERALPLRLDVGPG